MGESSFFNQPYKRCRMKRTTSQVQMPAYQVSGGEVTIFWDEQTEQREDETVYSYAYCVASVYDDRAKVIEKIMATRYPSYGAEIAALSNGGESAAEHEAFRAQAKALADGWMAVK
jgi:hypothetical protein